MKAEEGEALFRVEWIMPGLGMIVLVEKKA